MTQRPIKFRAWDRTDKCLVNLEEISFDKDGSVYCVKHRGFSNTGGMYLYPGKTCDLMQFTGLLDKNGVEIYEGDVVKGDDFQRFSGNPVVKLGDNGSFVLEIDTGKSAYRESFFSFLQGEGDELRHLEVIGNIYENPDLLAPITN